MLGYPCPPPPPEPRRLTGRPTYPPSRPPNVFARGWVSRFEPAAPLPAVQSHAIWPNTHTYGHQQEAPNGKIDLSRRLAGQYGQ